MLFFLIGEVAVRSNIFDRQLKLRGDNGWGFEFQNLTVGTDFEFSRAFALDLHDL